MDHKLIKEFLEETENLGLLAEVHLDGTYADFTNSIMMTFAKTKGNDQTANFLIELFLTSIACQLAARPNINDDSLDPHARTFFTSCTSSFERSLDAYFSSYKGNHLAHSAVKGQYEKYLKELRQKEANRINIKRAKRFLAQLIWALLVILGCILLLWANYILMNHR